MKVFINRFLQTFEAAYSFYTFLSLYHMKTKFGSHISRTVYVK